MYFIRLIQGIFTVVAMELLLVGAANASNTSENITVYAGGKAQQTTAAREKAQGITQAQVQKVMDEFFKASKSRNIEKIMSFYAPNLSVELTVPTANGEQTMRANRDEYRQLLEQNMNAYQGYEAAYSNLKVTVNPDGKSAVATATVTESFTIAEQTLNATSESTAKLEVINNKILISSVKSNLTDIR